MVDLKLGVEDVLVLERFSGNGDGWVGLVGGLMRIGVSMPSIRGFSVFDIGHDPVETIIARK